MGFRLTRYFSLSIVDIGMIIEFLKGHIMGRFTIFLLAIVLMMPLGCGSVEWFGEDDRDDTEYVEETPEVKIARLEERVEELEEETAQFITIYIALAERIGYMEAEEARLDNEINKLGARWIEEKLRESEDLK